MNEWFDCAFGHDFAKYDICGIVGGEGMSEASTMRIDSRKS